MAAPPLMDGGPSKINPPNSHPSNPIHKVAMAAPPPKEKVSEEKVSEEKTVSTPQHEINKTAVIIGVIGVVALLFIAAR